MPQLTLSPVWAAFRVLRVFTKSLVRIADALEDIRDLYELDLESRNIRRIVVKDATRPGDRVEVMYGYSGGDEEL